MGLRFDLHVGGSYGHLLGLPCNLAIQGARAFWYGMPGAYSPSLVLPLHLPSLQPLLQMLTLQPPVGLLQQAPFPLVLPQQASRHPAYSQSQLDAICLGQSMVVPAQGATESDGLHITEWHKESRPPLTYNSEERCSVQIAAGVCIHVRMLLLMHMHLFPQTSDTNVPLPMPPSVGSGPVPAVSSERKRICFLSAGLSTVRRTWHARGE